MAVNSALSLIDISATRKLVEGVKQCSYGGPRMYD